MLLVRFGETFRERMPEWILSTGLLMWGSITLYSGGLFSQQQLLMPLLVLMPQPMWGWLTVLVGIIRLIFLFINGAWRPSAHIRALGCVFGSMVWGSLFLSTLGFAWLAPALALYGILLIVELMSLWFAAGDAKLADLSAKGKVEMM